MSHELVVLFDERAERSKSDAERPEVFFRTLIVPHTTWEDLRDAPHPGSAPRRTFKSGRCA
ncbi:MULTISPECIES: hypothetical protein [Pseudomonas syringae group]|uniref:hypothetical protein n=1 Tax=Pseudomonas syringae group TaxID=136849 RepID=UPI0011C48CD1|nr:hypothetical protein [Pseudomonas syringae group genomosp. 7]